MIRTVRATDSHGIEITKKSSIYSWRILAHRSCCVETS
ncbi:hypothetical protein RB4276 [Rhodopirellula baltica SH 1]|uniref:Uncharacterized protein n=1 Tax=Rhodopirellula baltica (strain DSM 10527 / NCIMB 13988 / SH1) TaxID=243090 RepID=Q7USV6_RHOBA|nr:hypothetical protein RB4276 [Rhodopirellula baltica SH 1]